MFREANKCANGFEKIKLSKDQCIDRHGVCPREVHEMYIAGMRGTSLVCNLGLWKKKNIKINVL